MADLKAILFDIDDTLCATTAFAKRARTAAVRAMIDAGLELAEEDVLCELAEVLIEFGSNYDHHFDKLLHRLHPQELAVNPALVVAAGFLSGYSLRKHWRVIVIFLFLSCAFVEFYSNRHFWEVPTRFAFSSRNAAYRIGLVYEAFGGGMDGHWVMGYGYVGVGPGNDNTNFHWHHRDIVNIYIGILARVGLVGLLPYLVVNFL